MSNPASFALRALDPYWGSKLGAQDVSSNHIYYNVLPKMLNTVYASKQILTFYTRLVIV